MHTWPFWMSDSRYCDGSDSGPHSATNRAPSTSSSVLTTAPVNGCLKPPGAASHTASSPTFAPNDSPSLLDARNCPSERLRIE